MKVINLISGPRNLSTALMYSFAQRDDMCVLDEPFYGYYLKNADVKTNHPSKEEVMESMELDQSKVISNINALSKNQHVFVKGMAHHYLDDEPKFILDWANVLYIRHPKKLIASFSKVIDNPSLTDIGIRKSSRMFEYLKKNGRNPIVIDSDELLKNPEAYLKSLCDLLDLPFTKKMLSWTKGGIPEDGIWAKHWYTNVHKSNGFAMQKSSYGPFPEHLQPLLEEALPYYNVLKNNILKNN